MTDKEKVELLRKAIFEARTGIDACQADHDGPYESCGCLNGAEDVLGAAIDATEPDDLP